MNIQDIIFRYSRDDSRILNTLASDGIDPLWPRLERAATNQLDGGQAMLSRYGIWSNTVRDNIITGMQLLENGDLTESKRLMARAVNALSAFSELQKYFDQKRQGDDQTA